MQTRVAKPQDAVHCWGVVKVSTRDRTSTSCEHAARQGFLTCAHHRRFEEDARLLRESLAREVAVLS